MITPIFYGRSYFFIQESTFVVSVTFALHWQHKVISPLTYITQAA